ncbi:MAG: Fe-S-binding domain-containing protein, partial [Acidimicrobiales bacterium]|nr:Fe-S-binding domain-containing protein [Acidimicrobiales bacterium]
MIAASGHSAAATFPLLTTVVVLPAVGALVVSLLSRRRPELSRTIGLIFSVITGAVSIAILVGFDRHEAGFQMVEKVTWIRDLDIAWHLGVDGISLFLVVMTGILFPIALLGAPAHHDDKPFIAWMLLLEAGCMGVFLALDLFVFFVMFEIVLVPMYFLIAGWGYAERRYAAMKFFLYTMFGSAFMLVGLVATAVLHGRATGQITFDLVTIASDQGAIAANSAR